MGAIAKTPEAPYYAVIFTSDRTAGGHGYAKMGDEIARIVSKQKGFLGVESVRDEDGFGITISYWDAMESIQAWKNNVLHAEAKAMGKEHWYTHYQIRICKVESDHFFQTKFSES